MSDTPKPEQIQANVAAALSRLRGDVMPPITSSSTGGAGGPGGLGSGGPGSGGPGSGGAAAAPSVPQNAAPNAAAASSGPAQPQSGLPGSSQAGSPPSNPAQPSPAQPGASPAAAPANPAGTPSYFSSGLRADPNLGLGNGASTMSTSGMTPSGSSSNAGGSLRPSTATGSSYFKSPLSAGGNGAGNAGAGQPDLLSGMEMGPPPLGGAYPPSEDDKGAAKRKRNRLLVLGGAAVALVIVGAIWLGSGHSGQVPVITADTSPEKVKPTDAGGLQVPNQNVQVLENMNGQNPQQSGETVLPPPEQPIAPPAPPAVTDTDAAAQTGQAANGQPANGQPASGEQAGQQAGLAAPSVPAVPDAPAVPSVPATPDAASAAVTAQAPAVPAENATANTSSSANSTANTAPAKPTATQTAAKPAEASKTTTQPTATAGGKVKIQLAAVKTEAAAKSEWTKLQKAHPGQLGKLNLIVQKFTKDGTVYYRVQAGPLADRTAAKSICSELAKQKQACIVAR